VAVLVRALARPSLRWGLAALGVSALAVGTRTQFVAIPIVFGLLLLARPRDLRRHLVPVAGLAALAVLAVLGGTALLGTYNGVLALDLDLGGTARWTLATAALLPFAAGLLLFPGAVLGLGALAARPRSAAEGAFARLGIGLAAVFLVQAGVIAAGDAERPLERYVIYLTPLLAIGFFAYVERGAPWRRAYAALALALAAAAWLVPFSTLADHRFSFDSPVLSAYGTLAHWVGHANAATVFGVVALLAAVALLVRRLTPGYAVAVGATAIALLTATGLVAYAGDHAMAERAEAAWSGSPPDWLDELEVGRTDYLGLPGSSPHFAWNLEAWNRDFGRPIWLGVRRPPIDPWAASRAEVSDAGTLYVDGRPAPAGLLVVNDFGTQIELEGEVLARPREGLTLLRIAEGPQVRSLARGLYHDGWSNGDLRYEAWPAAGGVYRVELSLPAGLTPRTVALQAGESRRTILLEPGRRAAVDLRVDYPAPLHVSSDRVELVDGQGANPRFRSFVVERIAFEPFTLSVSF
jgi:hypothetical protein